MKYDEIKQLMDDMGNSKLTSIDIEFPDGIKISMKKENNNSLNNYTKEDEKENLQVQEINETVIKTDIKNENKEGQIVTSPMVGTFYLKSSPTSNNYVEIGDIVKKGTILCIIEAMKLMNEIESEYNGEIAEIYVKDGESVEYGMPLFRIK